MRVFPLTLTWLIKIDNLRGPIIVRTLLTTALCGNVSIGFSPSKNNNQQGIRFWYHGCISDQRKPLSLNLLFITSFEVNNYVSSHFKHYVCMSDCERRKKTGAALLCQMIEYKMHSENMEYWEPCWNVLNQCWVQFVFYHFIKIQGDKSRWR